MTDPDYLRTLAEPPSPIAPVDMLAATLGRYRYRFANEAELQSGIELALGAAGIECAREVRIKGGRLDFLCAGVAIEVKVDGSLDALTRQVHRYAQESCVTAVLVVTSRGNHRDLPDEISGKPVRVLRVAA